MDILIIEDDLKIRRELDTLLVSNGYNVEAITNFSNILDELKNYKYDRLLKISVRKVMYQLYL